jgi:hypothetical protein
MSKTLEKKILPMDNSALKVGVSEDEDLRSGTERRQFSYTAYIPERRSGKDRRRNHIENRRQGQKKRLFSKLP